MRTHCSPGWRDALQRRARLLWLLLSAGLLAGCAASPAAPAAQTQPAARKQSISYWLVVRQDPRPLRIHHLKIDLSDPGLEVVPGLAADPDGAGPATAALEPPLAIAERCRARVFVNANPWRGLLDSAGQRTTNWRAGLPVEVLGLTVADGKVRNGDHPEHCAFWLDDAGRPHMGHPAGGEAVRQGVAGFAQLVRDGKVVVPDGGPIHPRTALGLDKSGRWLYLVVVDGRQEAYSMGMPNDELARYMIELGCTNAMNLDGGGSSIMMLRDEAGELRTLNDPSTKENGRSVARPIPVGLVVREK